MGMNRLERRSMCDGADRKQDEHPMQQRPDPPPPTLPERTKQYAGSARQATATGLASLTSSISNLAGTVASSTPYEKITQRWKHEPHHAVAKSVGDLPDDDPERYSDGGSRNLRKKLEESSGSERTRPPFGTTNLSGEAKDKVKNKTLSGVSSREASRARFGGIGRLQQPNETTRATGGRDDP